MIGGFGLVLSAESSSFQSGKVAGRELWRVAIVGAAKLLSDLRRPKSSDAIVKTQTSLDLEVKSLTANVDVVRTDRGQS